MDPMIATVTKIVVTAAAASAIIDGMTKDQEEFINVCNQ